MKRRKVPTVGAVIDAYLRELDLRRRAGGLAEATLVSARHYLGSFKDKYGTKLCQKPDCSKADIVEWLLANPAWDSPHTKSDAAGRVVACMRWAEDDLIDHTPYKRPRGLWAPPQPRQAMKPEEYRAIMDLARGCRGGGGGAAGVTFRTAPKKWRRDYRRERWKRTIRRHLGDHRGPLFLFRCNADEQWAQVKMAFNNARSVEYMRVESDDSGFVVVATAAPPDGIYARDISPTVAIKRLVAELPTKGKGGQGRTFSSSYRWALLPSLHDCKGSGHAPRPSGRKRSHPGRKAFRLGLWFLWHTGCRTCEMRNARFADVDWDSRTIRLTEHKTKKATGLDRIIVLNRRAFRLVQWLHRRRRPGQEFIFLNSRGRAWDKSTFSKQFRRFAEMAGVSLEVSPYSARHGYCVRALEHGMGERQTADLLGQASTKYVTWYGKSTRNKVDYLRNLAEQL